MSEKIVVDRARVMHIAKLAALSLSDAEADALTHDLGRVVGYVEELGAVDTTDVPPTAYVQLGLAGASAAWRDDETLEGLSHEDALAQAPRVEHEGFAVPGFIEG